MNIIVTGAGKGIGLEIVKHLGQEHGHRILALSRNIDKLYLLSQQNNPLLSQIYPFRFDLVKGNISTGLVPLLNELEFRIDVLVNNAGALVNKPVKHCTDDDFDHVFRTNVFVPFQLVRDLLGFFSSDSHIVNIGSMGGYQGSAKFPGLALYSASKGALAVLTECLAEELKPLHIHVNCLALGAVQTEMLTEAFPGYAAPVSAADMGRFVADFAIRGQRYFNGKVLPISVSTP